MRLLVAEANPSKKYPIAILIKATSFKQRLLKKFYFDPLVAAGVARSDISAYTLDYTSANKAPVGFQKTCLSFLLRAVIKTGATTLLIADAAYFKTLTGSAKADPHHGYILPCSIKGYEHLQCILSINHSNLFYNPDLSIKLDKSIITAAALNQTGLVIEPGNDVYHSEYYPSTLSDIKDALKALEDKPVLTIDIEGFSLRYNKATIATIAFAWSRHDGIAFDIQHTRRGGKKALYIMLKRFFQRYTGTCIYHNCSYDVQVIIHELFMHSYLDMKGMINGLDVMFRDTLDTKIITYLATNTTAGNHLDLKSNTQEYMGNYAQDDINDITLINRDELLKYNLGDCLATFWLYEKNYPRMLEDEQEFVHETLFKPAMRTLCQMQLTGMPLNMRRVLEVEKQLIVIRDEHASIINVAPLIKWFEKNYRWNIREEANAQLKKKVHPISKFSDYRFNPGSSKQLGALLFAYFKFPIEDRTDKGAPATGGDVLQKHLNYLIHTKQTALCVAQQELLKAIISLAAVDKILSTFIKAFKKYSILKEDGVYYLHGSFNLGGTVSGRLSSSSPNLTNLPSNSTYGKLIKSCFVAPPGYLMAGADFNSLEDMISALTTKDPNKMRVYEEHYDGHSLRAHSYYGDQMPDIVLAKPTDKCFKTTHEDGRIEYWIDQSMQTQ